MVAAVSLSFVTCRTAETNASDRSPLGGARWSPLPRLLPHQATLYRLQLKTEVVAHLKTYTLRRLRAPRSVTSVHHVR